MDNNTTKKSRRTVEKAKKLEALLLAKRAINQLAKNPSMDVSQISLPIMLIRKTEKLLTDAIEELQEEMQSDIITILDETEVGIQVELQEKHPMVWHVL